MLKFLIPALEWKLLLCNVYNAPCWTNKVLSYWTRNDGETRTKTNLWSIVLIMVMSKVLFWIDLESRVVQHKSNDGGNLQTKMSSIIGITMLWVYDELLGT